ncbi:YraN family protein [Bifidobacterium platyrrhinorum]
MQETPPARAGLDALADRLRDGTLATRALGALGEDYTAAWLRERGWTVLDRNWRSRYGELDIVALDPHRVIAFVEVKTRRTLKHGLPQEAVTAAKQANLRRAGVQWLLDPSHRIAHTGVRFDVATVVVRGGRPLVHLIEGAF